MSAPRQDPIDAALESGRVTATDPNERELQALALAIRDDAPQPDPAFQRELDRRIAYRFKRPRRFGLPAVRGPWIPALAGAAAVAAAILVGISLFSGGSSSTKSISSQPPPSRGAGGATVGAGGRKVEHSARLTITAPRSRLAVVGAEIGQVCRRSGGVVVTSKLNAGSGGRYVLHVPANHLGAVLSALTALGDVTARTESGQDMTGPYNQAHDRLGSALDEQQALSARLAGATGTEAADIRNQLKAVSAEVRTLGVQMRQLKSRTAFATVTVTLRPG